MILEKVKKYLPSRKAFTALLVGSILAILVGAILLIVAYVVVAAVMGTIPTNYSTSGSPGGIGTAGAALNTSLGQTLTNIAMALNIAGISLIVAGIAGIIYMLIGLTRSGGSR